MPVNDAGWRMEPGARPAATAAAEPPDEPPGTRSLPAFPLPFARHGFFTGP